MSHFPILENNLSHGIMLQLTGKEGFIQYNWNIEEKLLMFEGWHYIGEDYRYVWGD